VAVALFGLLSTHPGVCRAEPADFREVEANLRALGRELRAQVAFWDGSKSALLDEVVGSRASITNSDRAAASKPATTSCSPRTTGRAVGSAGNVHGPHAIGEQDLRMRHIQMLVQPRSPG
jgi:hypothetical protein